ncbi:MAG: peptidylprolyl isomerase [Caldisericia bacterium]|nr:peptidylprolyl isomerase [Caldisericia bacterium]
MKKYISMFVALLLVVGMVTIFAACGEKKEETPATETTTSTETTTTETKTEEPKTEETKEEPKAEEKAEETPATGDFLATVVFETNYGNYEIGLYKDTPVASNNMIEKAKAGFYNNLTFHRVISDFMIQGGDPKGDGTGGGNMQMDPKPAGNTNKKGAISMASSSQTNPLEHQSDCQFFINTGDNLRLDSDYGFVAFGEVTSGWETIEKIASVPVGPGMETTPSVPLEKVIITKAYVK